MFPCQLHHVTFDRFESHTPFSSPITLSVNIPLTFQCISFVLNFTIANTVTRKEPSKPKREITNITNSQNTKRTYGQPSEQLFSKWWPLSIRNRFKNNMNTRKVLCHRNSDTKTGSTNHYKTTTLERSVMKYFGGGGGA